jgi:hypothetical protein
MCSQPPFLWDSSEVLGWVAGICSPHADLTSQPFPSGIDLSFYDEDWYRRKFGSSIGPQLKQLWQQLLHSDSCHVFRPFPPNDVGSPTTFRTVFSHTRPGYIYSLERIEPPLSCQLALAFDAWTPSFQWTPGFDFRQYSQQQNVFHGRLIQRPRDWQISDDSYRNTNFHQLDLVCASLTAAEDSGVVFNLYLFNPSIVRLAIKRYKAVARRWPCDSPLSPSSSLLWAPLSAFWFRLLADVPVVGASYTDYELAFLLSNPWLLHRAMFVHTADASDCESLVPLSRAATAALLGDDVMESLTTIPIHWGDSVIFVL